MAIPNENSELAQFVRTLKRSGKSAADQRYIVDQVKALPEGRRQEFLAMQSALMTAGNAVEAATKAVFRKLKHEREEALCADLGIKFRKPKKSEASVSMLNILMEQAIRKSLISGDKSLVVELTRQFTQAALRSKSDSGREV